MEPTYDLSSLKDMSIHDLKDISFNLLEQEKKEIITKRVENIKAYKEYDDIKNTYNDIRNKDLYDLPLMFEWNTWRAMTMLNGGTISGNFILDDQGDPISTAPGNQGDIVCDYGDFGLLVEVTLSSGAKQYDMEGESVSRHLGKFKRDINKDAYCLFIAPKINENVITYFFTLHHLNLNMHGGYAYIIPLSLDVFEKMVEDSYKASTIPTPNDIKKLFDYSRTQAKSGINEIEWYEKVNNRALSWLS
ncbi:AlwI family type II restriction endonuclease [Macrococcoides caseolyticum]|nr:AlwI family type II restriction endonuclease [Macrococcus caseolyticus]